MDKERERERWGRARESENDEGKRKITGGGGYIEERDIRRKKERL